MGILLCLGLSWVAWPPSRALANTSAGSHVHTVPHPDPCPCVESAHLQEIWMSRPLPAWPKRLPRSRVDGTAVVPSLQKRFSYQTPQPQAPSNCRPHQNTHRLSQTARTCTFAHLILKLIQNLSARLRAIHHLLPQCGGTPSCTEAASASAVALRMTVQSRNPMSFVDRFRQAVK